MEFSGHLGGIHSAVSTMVQEPTNKWTEPHNISLSVTHEGES